MSAADDTPLEATEVALGVISRPHGVRGELRVHPYNEDSTLLKKLKSVHLVGEDGSWVEHKVLSASRAAKYFIFRLESVIGREAADALRGFEVRVERDALPDLPDDEFYFVDLEGLDVLQDEKVVGKVLKVLRYPSVDCLLVRSDDGEREVPILEQWIQGFDLDAGVVRVGPWDDVPLV